MITVSYLLSGTSNFSRIVRVIGSGMKRLRLHGGKKKPIRNSDGQEGRRMSALGQNRTLGGRLGRVRSTPQSGHCRTGLGMSALCQPLLFDHLVGERKQIIGDGNSKCLCSLKIDDQLKFSYLLDRQVLGLRPSENLRSIKPELTVCIGDAHAVAQHSASNSPIAKLVDSRQ